MVKLGAGEVRTIGPFLGYIMMINMCLGTGFLGVPFSFFYAGYLAAIPTLLFVAFLSWLNCSWLLEVMARAQASAMSDSNMHVLSVYTDVHYAMCMYNHSLLYLFV